MEDNMKNRIWIALIIAAFVGMALPMSALAQVYGGCSNATLHGDYAFTVSGQIFTPTGALVDTRAGVAMTHFDGLGDLTQNDYVMSSSADGASPGPSDPLTGFHTNETGSYTVFPDCTGEMEIDGPAPPDGTGGVVIKLKIVLYDGGRGIHTVVTSLTPPGSTTSVNAIITSQGQQVAPALPAVQFGAP
jgi:hypothetical protein